MCLLHLYGGQNQRARNIVSILLVTANAVPVCQLLPTLYLTRSLAHFFYLEYGHETEINDRRGSAVLTMLHPSIHKS
jgi:hypothetical protein